MAWGPKVKFPYFALNYFTIIKFPDFPWNCPTLFKFPDFPDLKFNLLIYFNLSVGTLTYIWGGGGVLWGVLKSQIPNYFTPQIPNP